MITTKIPAVLVNLKQWVCWKLITKENDKPTKVPLRTDGGPASSADPNTWDTFENASVAAEGRYSGIGFVFSESDPFCGIDFDACRDPKTGVIEEWAKEWIRKLDSYSEVSPSKTGVKVWIKGKLPDDSKKKVPFPQYKKGDKTPGIECYDHGRYFAVTGWRFDKLPFEPQDRQAILNDLYAAYLKPDCAEQARSGVVSTSLSVIERARRYLDTIPGAISGSGGHDQTFHAACVLVIDFALTKQEALILMSDYNRRCEPKWTERELRHKVDSADKQPGQRGKLRDSKDSDWKSINIPQYKDPTAKPQNAQINPSAPTITTLQDSANKYLENLSKGKQKLISTGIFELDDAIGGGVDKGEMVIVAARPSHGKSAFALQALNDAAWCQIPSAIVSQEMSAIALGKRTVQFASGISEGQWQGSIKAVQADVDKHFSNRAPCYVIEGCGSAQRAIDALKDLYDKKGVRIAAIDYAQLLTSKGRSRYEEITQTSIVLRQFASNTGMTLYVLCQLSRAIEGREKFIPRLDDLKDSGQLEQDADVIMFLVWPYKINPKKDQRDYEIWLGKNRNRPINHHEVDCIFDPSRQKIRIATSSFQANVSYPEQWNYGQ